MIPPVSISLLYVTELDVDKGFSLGTNFETFLLSETPAIKDSLLFFIINRLVRLMAVFVPSKLLYRAELLKSKKLTNSGSKTDVSVHQ